MSVHQLKIAPLYFGQQVAGTKTFELRQNDRDFRVGDTIRLQEWDGGYTGAECTRVIVGMLEGPAFGLAAGWVILSTAEKGGRAA